MPDGRYFIPEHASLKDVYSKDALRGLLQAGKLSRSDIVFDDQTGLAHLLGDLLMTAYRESRVVPLRPTADPEDEAPKDDETPRDDEAPVDDVAPREHEFRAHTPLPETGRVGDAGDDDPDVSSDENEAAPSEPHAVRMQSAGPEEPDESDGEELLYHGHPSWLAYPKSVLALLAFSGAAWVFHRYRAGLAWVIVSGALAVLPLLFVALYRATTSYFITSRRVEMESGILGRSTKEVRIADIRAIDVEQGGWNAVVGIGNVRFDSAAGPDAEVEFIHVRRPHHLKHAVRELQG